MRRAIYTAEALDSAIMVMIRCPSCGQHVLDVASSCPKCRRVLIQNPLETHDWGALRACGRCGKHIAREEALCPYCGHHVRAARLAWRAALGAAVLVVLAAAGVGLWRSGTIQALRDAIGARREPAVSTQPPPEPTPLPAMPGDSAAPLAAPIVAVAPDTMDAGGPAAAPGRPTRAPVAEPAARPADAAPRPRDLVTRWTLEWANVRAARSVESAVVQVLPPGRAIEVREMREGWWALLADGVVVGYIANSVLTTDRPTT